MPYQETKRQIEVSQQQLDDTWRLAEASLGSIFPDGVRGLFENDPDHNVPRICSFAMRLSGPRDEVEMRILASNSGFADYTMLADLLGSRGTHRLEVATTRDQKTGIRSISFSIYTYGEFTDGTVRLLLEDAVGEKSACIQCETGYNDAGSYTRGIGDTLGNGPTPQGFPLVELLAIYQSEFGQAAP